MLEFETLEQVCMKAIREAGPRYTEATHVDLAISKHFEAMCGDRSFLDTVHQTRGELWRSFARVNRPLYFGRDSSLVGLLKLLEESVNLVVESIRNLPTEYDQKFSDHTIASSVVSLSRQSQEFNSKLYHYEPEGSQANKNKRSEKDEYRNDFWRFSSAVNAMEELVHGMGFKLFMQPHLWISGIAGSGKTHLLCDTAKKRLESSAPTLLILGQQLSTEDIWTQLCAKLNLPTNGNPKFEFFKATKELSKKYNSKLLILIDAVNEGVGLKLWPNNLESFRTSISEASHLAVSLSCRTTYESAMSPTKNWLTARHIGFERNLYEATKRYFQYYQIKSHEIPLIGEFGNPLFLKTYCEALEGYNLTSPSRGHKGIKSIHEKYFHKIDSRIGVRLSYPKSIKPCHEVAHAVAREMANHGQEWISIEQFNEVVRKVQSKYQISGNLSDEILSEGLLSRDYFYDPESNAQREAVRFGFQKFSDIFVAREILLQNKLTKNNIASDFISKASIKNLLKNSYQNRNLLEALSILIPEWTKGAHELITLAEGVAPDDALAETFIDSLVWRDLDAFPENKKLIVDLFRKIAGYDKDYYHKTLVAILTVSTTPGHPINGLFLDEHLMRKVMPIRDSSWIPFLNSNYDEDGVISRIIDWPRNIDLSLTTDDSLYLLALTICWFFTSSNRYIRDRSTKSLVSILVVRPDFALKLLKHFEKVDDAYVMERLSTAIYGMVVRSVDSAALEPLCRYIYIDLFLNDQVPENIVIRYYWKNIVETLIAKGVRLEIERSKITPPFKTKWPTRIPSKAFLERKYGGIPNDRNNKLRGVTAIYSSVMSFGDFARYVIGTNSNRSPWRSKTFESIDARIKRFRSSLDKKGQKSWFDLLLKFYRSGTPTGTTDLQKQIIQVVKTEEKIFFSSLTDEQKKCVNNLKRILKNPEKHRGRFIELDVIQRMVLSRVFSLGYDAKLHGEFDVKLDLADYHRRADKPERIGKKYQWIAYFDCLGLISDHFDHVDRFSGEITPLDRLDDMSYIDQIDPTITARNSNELPKEDVRLGISFLRHNNWREDLSNEEWLRDESDLTPPTPLIERVDSKGDKWLLMDGGYIFKQEAPPDKDRSEHPIRDIFYFFNTYIYHKSDERKVRKFLEDKNFIGRWMPENRERITPHFGEFYNRAHRGDDSDRLVWRKSDSVPFKFQMTSEHYLYEKGNFDCSLDEGMSIYMPSFQLASKMNLSFGRFDGSYYEGTSSELIAFNVSSKSAPFGLMFSKKHLLKLLREKNLGVFWTQISEKQVFGESYNFENWLGRLEYSTGLMMEGEQLLEVGRKIKFNSPS